jgi:hypothetical protein
MAVSKEQRNARLDALGTAITEWATGRRDTLKKQVAFSKRVLKGRTGAERLNQASIESATALTVDQINDFLTGEGT